MKHNLIVSVMFVMICLVIPSVHAEYPLKDDSEIIGVWTVDAESPSLDGVKRPLNSEWEFTRDGTLISKSKDYRAAKGTLSSKLKYRVENGKIFKEIRPGRFEQCTVIEMEKSDMILRCRNLYFFLTKQQ